MKIVKMILVGILLLVLSQVIELLVTLPLPMVNQEQSDELARHLEWEFLLAALPALLITLLTARLMRLVTKADTLIHAVVWTVMLIASRLLLAVGNQNVGVIFSRIGLYVLFLFYFLGPVIDARLRKLP